MFSTKKNTTYIVICSPDLEHSLGLPKIIIYSKSVLILSAFQTSVAVKTRIDSRKLQTTKALAETRKRAPDFASRSTAFAALHYTSTLINTIHKKLPLLKTTLPQLEARTNFRNSRRELCTFSGSLIHPRFFFSSSRCLRNTKRSEGRTRKINKKGIWDRDRVTERVSRARGVRACNRGGVRRRTGARRDAAAAAANGGRSRDARARTTLVYK